MNTHKQIMNNRKDVIDECKIFTSQEGKCYGPCKRVDGEKCSAYMYPKIKWRLGHCPLASHWIDEISTFKTKTRIGQQKQTKH